MKKDSQKNSSGHTDQIRDKVGEQRANRAPEVTPQSLDPDHRRFG